jgi:hypothetical protein
MIVKFKEKERNIVSGLLIQQFNDHYYGYVFDMYIDEDAFGMESPKFNNSSLKGLITDFMKYYHNKLDAFKIRPIIGDSEYKEELVEILNKYKI